MNRLESITADAYVKKLERDLRELKNRQLAGASSIKIHISESSAVTFSVAGYSSTKKTVTFTADTGRNPFAELRYRVSLSGSPVSDGAVESIAEVREVLQDVDNKKKQWTVEVKNYGSGSTRSYSVVFYVASNSKGVVSA